MLIGRSLLPWLLPALQPLPAAPASRTAPVLTLPPRRPKHSRAGWWHCFGARAGRWEVVEAAGVLPGVLPREHPTSQFRLLLASRACPALQAAANAVAQASGSDASAAANAAAEVGPTPPGWLVWRGRAAA